MRKIIWLFMGLSTVLSLGGCDRELPPPGEESGGAGGGAENTGTVSSASCDCRCEDDDNPCTVDVCVGDKCLHLTPDEPISCPIPNPNGKLGVCAWGACYATSCKGMPDFTLCLSNAHALGQGVCVEDTCRKQCEVNQSCDDGVACTADWCENDPVNLGGFCKNEDSCAIGVCDRSTGLCDG